MDFETIVGSICILILGILMICGGLYSLFGPIDVWYIIYSPLLTLSRYALIPSGCFFVLVALAFYLSAQGSLFVINMGALIAVIGTLLLIKVPKLQPKWLQWLNKEHGDILDTLKIEILREGDWNKRVRTQEDLEIWVQQVKDRQGI